jgi:hypothetical protein
MAATYDRRLREAERLVAARRLACISDEDAARIDVLIERIEQRAAEDFATPAGRADTNEVDGFLAKYQHLLDAVEEPSDFGDPVRGTPENDKHRTTHDGGAGHGKAGQREQ